MTEDDPFADLGETLEDDSAEDAETEREAGSATTGDSPPEEQFERDPITDTAFSYEEAKQRPFYAREETIEEFDSWLKFELERELNRRGYQNIVVREMTDALLRAAVEEDIVQEVTERFERAREAAPADSK